MSLWSSRHCCVVSDAKDTEIFFNPSVYVKKRELHLQLRVYFCLFVRYNSPEFTEVYFIAMFDDLCRLPCHH